jgi:predicted esterase
VDGLRLDLAGAPPVAIGHGTFDEVIPVEFGRDARRRLEEAGIEPIYREYPYPHAVDPRFLIELRPWIAAALTQAAA